MAASYHQPVRRLTPACMLLALKAFFRRLLGTLVDDVFWAEMRLAAPSSLGHLSGMLGPRGLLNGDPNLAVACPRHAAFAFNRR